MKDEALVLMAVCGVVYLLVFALVGWMANMDVSRGDSDELLLNAFVIAGMLMTLLCIIGVVAVVAAWGTEQSSPETVPGDGIKLARALAPGIWLTVIAAIAVLLVIRPGRIPPKVFWLVAMGAIEQIPIKGWRYHLGVTVYQVILVSATWGVIRWVI